MQGCRVHATHSALTFCCFRFCRSAPTSPLVTLTGTPAVRRRLTSAAASGIWGMQGVRDRCIPSHTHSPSSSAHAGPLRTSSAKSRALRMALSWAMEGPPPSASLAREMTACAVSRCCRAVFRSRCTLASSSAAAPRSAAASAPRGAATGSAGRNPGSVTGRGPPEDASVASGSPNRPRLHTG